MNAQPILVKGCRHLGEQAMLRTTIYVDWNGHHMKLTWIPYEEAPDITKCHPFSRENETASNRYQELYKACNRTQALRSLQDCKCLGFIM